MSRHSVKHLARLLAVSSMVMATVALAENGAAGASADNGSMLPAHSAHNPFPYALPSYCSAKTVMVQGHRISDGAPDGQIPVNVATCRPLAGQVDAFATANSAGSIGMSKVLKNCATTGQQAHLNSARLAARSGVRPHIVGQQRDGRNLPCGPNQSSSGRAREYDYNVSSGGGWIIQYERPNASFGQAEIDESCPQRPNGAQYCDVPYNFPKDAGRAYYHISFYWNFPGTIQSAGCYS